MGLRDRWAAVTAGLTDRARVLRRRHRWLDHLMVAGGRYRSVRGTYLAAAITYFSFLALFPLLLLVVFVGSVVLLHHPDLLDRLRHAIADAVPGQVGDTLSDMVSGAIDARGTIGVIGVLGTLYAGLGWADNLRTAAQAVWCVQDDRPYLRRKLGDLFVLVGLGVAAALSVGLTTTGTVATHRVVGALGLAGLTGVGVFARVCGVGLAILADTAVFAWVFARLPRRRAPYREVAAGAVFAAVGFELLKIVGAVYARRVSASPTAGVFGNAIGLLVWLNLFARFLLFAMAWTSVHEDRHLPGTTGTTGTTGTG